MAKYDYLLSERRDIKVLKTYGYTLNMIGLINKAMLATVYDYIIIPDCYFAFAERITNVCAIDVKVGKEWKHAENVDDLAKIYGATEVEETVAEPAPAVEEVKVEEPVVESTPVVEEVKVEEPVAEEEPIVEEAAPVEEEVKEEEEIAPEEDVVVDEASKRVVEPILNNSSKKKSNKKKKNLNVN